MAKIVKSFSEKTTEELTAGGVTNFIPWDRLKQYLEIAARIKPDEQMDGIIIDETGIRIRISDKPKPNNNGKK